MWRKKIEVKDSSLGDISVIAVTCLWTMQWYFNLPIEFFNQKRLIVTMFAAKSRLPWHFCVHAKRKKLYGLLSPLMFLFATCARYSGGNETKSGCVFRASWDHVEDGILTWAVLDSSPAFCLVLGVYRCHEMVFFSPPAAPLWWARCLQPERLSLIKQAFQSRCHGYLEREMPGQRAAIGNLSIL